VWQVLILKSEAGTGLAVAGAGLDVVGLLGAGLCLYSSYQEQLRRQEEEPRCRDVKFRN
jgi:hypothetical protein